MENYIFGVDIGGTAIKMGLFNIQGELMEDWEILTRREGNGQYILSDIVESLDEKMEQHAIFPSDVAGIGVGVPGPVNIFGTVLGCPNLGWGEFNVAGEFFKMTGIPSLAGNDANVAALGEMWKGGGRGHQNIVMVTLGTGVGGGIIVDGNILPGADGAAGEIGHIFVNRHESECCGCGKHGCLEQYASATGIVRSAVRLLQESEEPSLLRKLENITAKDILDAAKAGDALGKELLEKLGETIGIALSQIACICNPEIFVIGGGVSKAGTILTATIEKYFRQYAFPATAQTAVVLAELGNKAGIYGGAKLFLNADKCKK